MFDAPDIDTREPAERGQGAAVLQGLSPGELVELINKLRLFAARRYYRQLDVDDLTMQAIADALEGKRSWNSDYPPFHNLCLILRSIASNQLQKERRLTAYGPPVEVDSGQPAPSLPTHPSPAEIHETDETRQSLRTLLGEAVGGDSLLRRLVGFFLERQVWKPKEMADALGVSEPRIYEAKRRIRRRLNKLHRRS